MSVDFRVGDVFDELAEIPDGSIDLVLTSPPFLALRSYLPPDHPKKHLEVGAEMTPAEFIDTLLRLTAEFRRVLAPHGSIAVELGDTYAGSGGSGGDYAPGGMREGQAKWQGTGRSARESSARMPWKGDRPGWPLDKSLCLVPELFRIGLSYGVNPLTGKPSPAGRWRVRNVVRWCRPNPPVGALGDKVRPATSDIVVACLDRKRYFDLDAVRTPSDRTDPTRTISTQYDAPGQTERQTRAVDESGARIQANTAGAPPHDDWWFDDDRFDQDAWRIPTAPYKGSHYATWPPALCELPIKAMAPQRVCLTCGKPSERIVGEAEYVRLAHRDGDRVAEGVNQHTMANGANTSVVRSALTLGWTDCGHDDWRPGVVLDPFAGSGTTLAVATRLDRDAIGIDIDERNLMLAYERVGERLRAADAAHQAHLDELERERLAGTLFGALA